MLVLDQNSNVSFSALVFWGKCVLTANCHCTLVIVRRVLWLFHSICFHDFNAHHNEQHCKWNSDISESYLDASYRTLQRKCNLKSKRFHWHFPHVHTLFHHLDVSVRSWRVSVFGSSDWWPICKPLLLTNKISKPIIYVAIHECRFVLPSVLSHS